MTVSRSMNELEIRVLNMIINCATFDLPIQASEIRLETGLAPYRRQILTEQKNLAAVMNVDLEKYWGNSA